MAELRMGISATEEIVGYDPLAASEQAFYFRLKTAIPTHEDSDHEDFDYETPNDEYPKRPRYRLIAYNLNDTRIAAQIVKQDTVFINLNDEFLISEVGCRIWRFYPISTDHREVRVRLVDHYETAYDDGFFYGLKEAKKYYSTFRVSLFNPGIPVQWSHVRRPELLATQPRTWLLGMNKDMNGNIVATETVCAEKASAGISTILFNNCDQPPTNMNEGMDNEVSPIITIDFKSEKGQEVVSKSVIIHNALKRINIGG